MELIQSNICAGDALFLLQFMKKYVFIMNIGLKCVTNGFKAGVFASHIELSVLLQKWLAKKLKCTCSND
jgi:hypothetical protein